MLIYVSYTQQLAAKERKQEASPYWSGQWFRSRYVCWSRYEGTKVTYWRKGRSEGHGFEANHSETPEAKGHEEAKQLEATLKWAASVAKNPGNVRRICELGIGLNPNAHIIGAMIVDDKTLGTAHIGIGSNYWFGGNIYAIIHLDQVFKNPTVYLDGKILKI